MDLIFVVYLIDTVIPAIIGLKVGTFVTATTIFVALIVWWCFTLDDYHLDDEEKEAKIKNTIKPRFKCVFSLLSVGLILSLVPSKDTAYKMMAVYAGQELIALEGTKEVGSKAYQALNKVLDDFLVEEEVVESTLE